MKKLLLIGLLAISATSFSKSHNRGKKALKEFRNRVINSEEYKSLSANDKKELASLNKKFKLDQKKLHNEIAEIAVKMRKEKLRGTPNRAVLNNLIDRKVKYMTVLQKNIVAHSIEIKEKFGIDLRKFGNMGRGQGQRKKS